MEQQEAQRRVKAVEHAAYVLERAEAAVAGTVRKIGKARAYLAAAEEAQREAESVRAAAEADLQQARAAAAEVPAELGGFPAGEVVQAHAGVAAADGEAPR